MTKKALKFTLGFLAILSLSFILIFIVSSVGDQSDTQLGVEGNCPNGEEC